MNGSAHVDATTLLEGVAAAIGPPIPVAVGEACGVIVEVGALAVGAVADDFNRPRVGENVGVAASVVPDIDYPVVTSAVEVRVGPNFITKSRGSEKSHGGEGC